MGEGTAIAASLLVCRPRDDGAIATGIWISPGNWSARLAAFQRIHLRRVSALLVLIVESRSDAIADQSAQDSANRRTSYSTPRPPTCYRRSQQGTCASPHESSSGLLWTRRWPWPRAQIRARSAGSERKTDDGD